jgi:plastocyanin
VVAVVAAIAGLVAPDAEGWDVRCEHEDGSECTDPYDRAQTFWPAHPRAEHRAILERTLEISGLPAAFRDPFTLAVYTSGQPLSATVKVGDGPQTFTHESIRPMRIEANRTRIRELTIQGMASTPDFSYALWDWASGNELCPPDPGSADAIDCHNYETHIGWLNSNHMLPQSRRFYEHLHGLAITRAKQCKAVHDEIPEADRERFMGYVLACEREALALEGVGQHYLQDSWATGHMWERWGGPEIADFGGDRTLGFMVGAFVGSIHGSKAALDVNPKTAFLAPWDDPLNAPFADVVYRDGVTGDLVHGAGDVFLQSDVFGQSTTVPADQRRSMLGCAVDGVRAVYAETARVHGPLEAADTSAFDASRSVANDSCWSQRVTNLAMSAGCGVHNGPAPLAQPFIPAPVGNILLWALSEAENQGLPPLSVTRQLAFQRDAAFACTLAAAYAAVPIVRDGVELASGGMPSIAGIEPNSSYARGSSSTPPASWADPFLPWTLFLGALEQKQRTEALHLTFLDAHAAERCTEIDATELSAQRGSVQRAQDGGDSVVIATRCEECARITAPHLRFGVEGDHDDRREALCAFVAPAPVDFVYTGEDPATFTGNEPTDQGSIESAARVVCGCDTTTTTTTTTLPQSATCQPQDFVDLTAPGADRTITYANFNPSPRCITIKVGQSVTFAAQGGVGHGIQGTRLGGGTGFNLNVPANGTAQRSFPAVAVFEFECNTHPGEPHGGIQVVN